MRTDILIARLEPLLRRVKAWDSNSTFPDATEFDATVADVAQVQTFIPELGDLRPPPRTAFTDIPRASERLTLESHIDMLLSVARAVHARGEPTVSVDREGIFIAGQGYDAHRFFQRIIGAAVRQIVLVDPYFGADALDALTARASPKVTCHVLRRAKAMDPALAQLVKSWRGQHGPIEVRGSDAFHDRCLLVDDDVYHLGHSVNGFGSGRVFMFSRIEEPVIVATVRKAFGDAWASAAVQA